MRRVLVTGAAGLIGRRVVEQLCPADQPIAVVRRACAVPAGAEMVVADLSDPQFVARLPTRVDAVIHLAQATEFAVFPEQALPTFRVNVAALAALLNWSRQAGVEHFVHASTGGLYGRGPKPFHEEDPARIEGPLAFYFASKRAAELLAQPYRSLMHMVALRLFFAYGPGQKSNMLIPRLLSCISNGTPVRLSGADGPRLNPIFVDDAAAAAVAALRLEGETVVNVAGVEALSIREIACQIGQQLGKPAQFIRSEEPESGDLVGDISRMQKLLHNPKIPLAEGVARFIHANSA